MTHNHKDENIARCIERVPIFSSLTQEETGEVMGVSTHKTFQKGEMLYMAGDGLNSLFVVHSGRVKISRWSADGKEQMIRMLGPGDFIGELSLFNQTTMQDNGKVMEQSIVCMVTRKSLTDLMMKYPSIARKILEELSRRLEQAERLIEEINTLTAEQRLAQALLRMADTNRVVTLTMTKGDFASKMGMSQETLSRKLALFQDKGLIRLEGQRRIHIMDADGLEME
ncbi:MAG: Crp/Fnr family transcriptional regulator [Bacillota bacterium]|nr:Crp/Fnr family transcriptional regulator [Bacillota bacterium]MDW7678896.1 Crp/Fnr family transcriptional regulator [Bacillota bacterium]